ncbi:hypothetical protein BC832DRAFT_535795, partial [Gaertneriomyces semiglobifer]
RPNRDAGPSSERLLESQNDDALSSLHSKISAIKNVTINIHDDVVSQNRLLDNMENSFDSAMTRTKNSMSKLKHMMSVRYHRNTCTIVGIAVLLFFLVWILWRQAG